MKNAHGRLTRQALSFQGLPWLQKALLAYVTIVITEREVIVHAVMRLCLSREGAKRHTESGYRETGPQNFIKGLQSMPKVRTPNS